jgi:hypothetical protein
VAGDEIRALGALPDHDSWTLSSENTPWYNLSWLYDVLISWMYQWGGATLLYSVHFAVIAGVLYTVIWRIYARGVGLIAMIITLIPAMMVLYSSLQVRPQLVTFGMVALFFYLLNHYWHYREAKTLYWLPVLMLVWVNMHGGFLLGYALIGAYGIQALMDKQWQQVRMLAFVCVLALIASVINPYGLAVYDGVLRTVGSGFTALIGEWAHFHPIKHVALAMFLLLFVMVADVNSKRTPLAEKLLAILFVFMSIVAVRHGPILIIIALPFIALSLQKALYASRYGELLEERDRQYAVDLSRPATCKWMKVILLMVGIFLLVPGGKTSFLGQQEDIAGKDWPEVEVQWLQKHHPDARVFNHYDMGGALAYIARGTPKYFIDGRAGTAFSEVLLQDYVQAMRLLEVNEMPLWLFDKYEMDVAIIPKGYYAHNLFEHSKAFKKVHAGPVASVFEYNKT